MKPLTHDDIMGRKCGLCLGNKNLRNINPTILARIKKYFYSGYCIGLCPRVICGSCEPALRDREKVMEKGSKPKHTLPSTDIEQIMARRESRSSASEGCNCGWCEVGHLKGQQLVNRIQELGYKNYKMGRPKSANPAPATAKKTAWRDEDSGVEKVCKDCKAHIGRGLPHVCTKRQRQQNIVTMLLRDLSPASRQRVQASLLKQDLHDVNGNTTSGSITMSSGTKKMTVTIGPQKKPMKQLSVKAFMMLKKANNLSKKQLKGVGTWLRAETGNRKIAEKGLADELPLMKEELRDFFDVKMVSTTRKEKSGNVVTETRPMVYCTDIEAFTTYVIGERDIEVEDIQVNIDDGQQVDKVQFNLFCPVSLLFFANDVQQNCCQSLTFLGHELNLEFNLNEIIVNIGTNIHCSPASC